jgi:hypothetical protein
MIIGLSGYMQSGKDTAGQIIQELTSERRETANEEEYQKNTFEIKKFAEKLKEVASIMTGIPREMFEDQEFKAGNMSEVWWEDGKPMTVRQFLQRLGTDAIRHKVHINAWVNSAMADVQEGDNVVFTDCRFPNEAQAIKDRGGIIIRINRYPPGMSPVFMDRTESEVSLDDWQFDHVIYNVGTIEDLKNQIKSILEVNNPKN